MYAGGSTGTYAGGSCGVYGGGLSATTGRGEEEPVNSSSPVGRGAPGPSPSKPPPEDSVRGGPSPVRPEPSPSPVRAGVSEAAPPEMVGGWLRRFSMAVRSSLPVLRAMSESPPSTLLLTPAPTNVVQFEEKSPSKAPLIRISPTVSPPPAAAKSRTPLSP
ncbi:hypothetical protein AN221_21970 [Streptomyces nanshensis]|uniref:Uncharacterized protein n=1 Tax=Streptomyces nanshensis TaxID=518642 RepID=A0A1E7LQV7_9ACTN|nr:hypothetical protein AN221_21970 [Streptomyces nanshensis]